jgi:hypothetical protein
MHLANLPNEILLHILSYIDLDRVDRILGHIPDDPPPNPPDPCLLEDYYGYSTALRNVALTCRRLHPLVREQLLYAPVVGDIDCSALSARIQPHVLDFVRTLATQPDHRHCVKLLRLTLPPSQNVAELPSSTLDRGDALLEEALKVLASLALPKCEEALWCLRLRTNIVSTLAGMILALLPQLTTLCISEQQLETHGGDPDTHFCSLLGPNSRHIISVPQGAFDALPAAHSLIFLKIESLLPIDLSGVDIFPNLHTLDLSIRLAGVSARTMLAASEQYYSASLAGRFRNIQHLRLDFQTKTVGIWQTMTRLCMANIVQAFQHLKSLDHYAEPSESKNPYRSVRAFPHYQTNIQNYPDASSLSHPSVGTQDYWHENVYVARTQVTDYQNLVDTLVHLRPRLETLRFPGGFWTLPGGMRKPLPRFDQFGQLTKLVVPQAAILSIKLDNMRLTDVCGDFELSPTTVLPPALRYLTVFDVSIDLLDSTWFRVLLDESCTCRRWPDLVRIKLLLGMSCRSTSTADIFAERGGEWLRRTVEEASCEIVIGIDDGVPSVNPIN